MDIARWNREWADVGAEHQPLTQEEQEAAEYEAQDAINAEWDALYAAHATTAGEEWTQEEWAHAETVAAGQ